MTLYVDSSAFLKLYLEEPDSEACAALMEGDRAWVSALHTEVEVRRILARELRGEALAQAREQFASDWARTRSIEIDERTCALAAEIAEGTGARTLDALHLGAAGRLDRLTVSFLTYDIRQAEAARAIGWTVVAG